MEYYPITIHAILWLFAWPCSCSPSRSALGAAHSPRLPLFPGAVGAEVLHATVAYFVILTPMLLAFSVQADCSKPTANISNWQISLRKQWQFFVAGKSTDVLTGSVKIRSISTSEDQKFAFCWSIILFRVSTPVSDILTLGTLSTNFDVSLHRMESFLHY